MTLELSYQTLPQHPPNDVLVGVVENETSFTDKVKKKGSGKVCQDDLHWLKAAFGDSFLHMQAQVY